MNTSTIEIVKSPYLENDGIQKWMSDLKIESVTEEESLEFARTYPDQRAYCPMALTDKKRSFGIFDGKVSLMGSTFWFKGTDFLVKIPKICHSESEIHQRLFYINIIEYTDLFGFKVRINVFEKECFGAKDFGVKVETKNKNPLIVVHSPSETELWVPKETRFTLYREVGSGFFYDKQVIVNGGILQKKCSDTKETRYYFESID